MRVCPGKRRLGTFSDEQGKCFIVYSSTSSVQLVETMTHDFNSIDKPFIVISSQLICEHVLCNPHASLHQLRYFVRSFG